MNLQKWEIISFYTVGQIKHWSLVKYWNYFLFLFLYNKVLVAFDIYTYRDVGKVIHFDVLSTIIKLLQFWNIEIYYIIMFYFLFLSGSTIIMSIVYYNIL